jgi:teichuronic acid biosynthesis glycosyltransferase TuaG
MNAETSIILPNFNSSATILSTIKSITNQTYKNWKLIIVDDYSDDKTKNILKKIKKNSKVKIFYLKKRRGPGYCRNFAIKKSKSSFIAFIDSDDLWEKNKLKSQINFMKKNNYSFTYTYYKTFSNIRNNVNLIRPPKKFTFKKFITNTSIGTSTMIIKSSIAKSFKFINTKICEDYFYKCQLLKKIKVAYCYPFFLTKYQIRENSLQSKKVRNLLWMWKINKKYNKFNFFKNLYSIFFISLNSLKKYGFK